MPIAEFLEAAATLLVFIASVLLIFPKRAAIYVFLVAQMVWGTFAILNQHWWMLTQCFILTGFNIATLISWHKRGVG